MILVISLMLICIASLTLYKTMDVTIHNQHSDIELVSPVYFCDGGTYNEYPAERMDASTVMRIGFRLGLDKLPGGILMYALQKKGSVGSDHQSSTSTTSIEAIENASNMMSLLVAWKIEDSEKPIVHIVLTVHENELILDEDKLSQLYNKIDCQLSRCYAISKSTWLVFDNTVLETTYEIVQKESIGLKIAIFEGVKDVYAKSAFWIDPERQALSMMI
jgi:hypothetical protein